MEQLRRVGDQLALSPLPKGGDETSILKAS